MAFRLEGRARESGRGESQESGGGLTGCLILPGINHVDWIPDTIVLPVPCNSESLAMAHALRIGEQTLPLTGLTDPDLLINGGQIMMAHEKDPTIHFILNCGSGGCPVLRPQLSGGSFDAVICECSLCTFERPKKV